MRNKVFKTVIFGFLMMTCCAMTNYIYAAESVKINKTNFPDDNLRTIISAYDKNDDGVFSDDEIDDIKFLEIRINNLAPDICNYDTDKKSETAKWAKYMVLDCKGLEHFTSLKELIIGVPPISWGVEVEVDGKLVKTELRNIKYLYKLNNLKKLTIFGEHKARTSYDVSKFEKLEYLNLTSTNIKQLDVSKNKNLKVIEINGNERLKKVDLSKNSKLKEIQVSYCSLKKIIFSKDNKIKTIDLRDNKLQKLNLSRVNKKTLKTLRVNVNPLKKINISDFKNLKWLKVGSKTKVVQKEKQNVKINVQDIY